MWQAANFYSAVLSYGMIMADVRNIIDFIAVVYINHKNHMRGAVVLPKK